MACADCDICPSDVRPTPNQGRNLMHEIHVTVHPRAGATPSAFDAMCRSLGFRGHVMDLICPDGSRKRDWMTGLSVNADDYGATHALVRHADEMAELGWDPIRVKIETVPWHPDAPAKRGDVMPAGAYWESHISAWLDDDEITLAADLVDQVGGYVSLNALREPRTRGGRDQYRASLTVRSSTRSHDDQDTQVLMLRDQLRRHRIEVDNKHRTEYTWLDRAYDEAAYGGPPLVGELA